MSTPLPGPSVTMSRTGRFGQASAAALGDASNSGSARMAAISVKTAQLAFTGRLMSISIAHLQPVIALIAGILILVIPRLLNFIVAVYLIIIGLLGLGLFR